MFGRRLEIMLIETFGHRQVLKMLQTALSSPIGRHNRNCRVRVNELSSQAKRHLSYSRMLDMGGAPSANSDQSRIRTPNASKNSRLQVVAFDFKTLINTNDAQKNTNDNSALDQKTRDLSTKQAGEDIRESSSRSAVDVDRIKQIATLLNVDLGSSTDNTKNDFADGTPSVSKLSWNQRKSKLADHNPSELDVRAKYASKLKGGLAGIELAKSNVEETLVSGDAAGHILARKLAIMDGAAEDISNVANRWLPSQAAAQLLTLLTNRSIRIVLLPTLDTKSTLIEDKNEPKMEDFKSQLKNVVIDNIVPKFDNGNSDDGIEDALRKGITNELDVDPTKVLLVSDRDPYLRVARDMGMSICRIRPKNARRGSISAHYNVQTVGEVQDVVNEINGISFNTVVNR